MSKKTKFNLEDIKVQSFVTVLSDEKNKIKGGEPTWDTLICGECSYYPDLCWTVYDVSKYWPCTDDCGGGYTNPQECPQ